MISKQLFIPGILSLLFHYDTLKEINCNYNFNLGGRKIENAVVVRGRERERELSDVPLIKSLYKISNAIMKL